MPEWLAAFIDAGGDTLWAILAVTVILWTLILERLWFYARVFPRHRDTWVAEWRERRDRSSWRARAIRRQNISQADLELRAGVRAIRTLIAVCPLLGLLGTVTGMIQVFDVMALEGTGDARAMASGVSRATIPTMAGMVVALSGLYFGTRLPQRARLEVRRLADRLDIREAEAA
ncbi:MotA/TolQ/ExbB proton channel family protein [Salinisphaera sp. PC39]|uniref:MotA/TolQ/ExbB proton channel family protein n=1 Tax=Salinisphaera sp. PC39 TaxID=1304156 RepID=UPI00333F9C75